MSLHKAKNISIKFLTEISRVLLGITFIFSGFVKSVDPLGTAYKIEDYLTSFNLSSLRGASDTISIILCAGELCLGLFILLGLYRKWTSYILFIVMLFMTPLTLYLAIANPVKDCGCFGDALVITNWQTFYKNIVLLICSIILLFWHQRITNLFTGKFYWLTGLYTVFFSLSFCLYNYMFEPIIDFRPYKPGANIPQLMTIDESKAPVYENILIYEKDGVQKEFTDDNYPWSDSTWTYVDTKTKLVKEGEDPLIHDFSIKKLNFNIERTDVINTEDITQEVLTDTGYTFLMISYSLSDAKENYLSRYEDVNNYAKEFQYNFYCLTATPEQTIVNLEKDNTTNFRYCQTDERTLKTIVRSNPGLMLIKNGTIINKFTGNEVPDESSLNKPIDQLEISKIPDVKQQNEQLIKNLLLLYFGPVVFLKLLDALLYHRKKKIKKE